MSTPLMIQRTFLFVFVLFVTGSVLLVCVYLQLPLALPVLGLAGVCVLLYLGGHYPEWFLVGALFAPQWKTLWLLRTVDRFADLTAAMLLCLAAGLTWRAFLMLGRSPFWNMRKVFLGQTNQILAFVIFAAILAASYFHTSAPDYGASKVLRFLLIGSLLLISPFFLIVTEDNLRRFARIFVGFSGATAIQLIAGLETRVQDENTDITRIGAGWLMGMAIILLLFYPLVRSRRGQRALFIFMLPLCIAGLVASAARGPLVAVLIAVLVGSVTWFRQGRLRGRTAVVLLLLFMAGFGGAYFTLRQADLGKYTAKAGEFKTLFTEGASSGSAGKRLDFYRTTLPAIPDHLLLGTGVGSWSMFYYRNDLRNYPHNLFLEIAFEEGLIGLSAFCAFLFSAGVSTFWMLRASRSHFLALGLMVFYCVLVSMFSGDLDDNRVLWLWIGVALAISRTVRLSLAVGRVPRRTFRQPSGNNCPYRGVPAFPGRFATEGHSVSKRSRVWREKFV
jgi:O-antigen ligase